MIRYGCAEGCLDAQTPERIKLIRARSTKVQEWASADAQFLRNLSMNRNRKEREEVSSPSNSPSIHFQRSPCHEAYAPRQTYLRSYPLGKATESVKKHKNKHKPKIQSICKSSSSSSSSSPSSSSSSPSHNFITRVLRFFLFSAACFTKGRVNEGRNNSAVAPLS